VERGEGYYMEKKNGALMISLQELPINPKKRREKEIH